MSRADELLTTGEVARLLRVKTARVNRWVHEGKLSAIRTPGGHARIRAEDVARLMRRDK